MFSEEKLARIPAKTHRIYRRTEGKKQTEKFSRLYKKKREEKFLRSFKPAITHFTDMNYLFFRACKEERKEKSREFYKNSNFPLCDN